MIARAISGHHDGLHVRKQLRQSSKMNVHKPLLLLCITKRIIKNILFFDAADHFFQDMKIILKRLPAPRS